MKKLILAVLIAMTSGAAIAENEQIVFSTPNLAMPFEVHMQRTAVKAAKEMGVNLQVLDWRLCQNQIPRRGRHYSADRPARLLLQH